MLMRALLFIPVVLSLLLLAAHFLRYGHDLGVVAPLILIGLLFVRKAWVARVIQVALVLGAIEWARTLYELVQVRVALGAPVARMAVILAIVMAVTATSAFLFQTNAMRRIYGFDRGPRSSD